MQKVRFFLKCLAVFSLCACIPADWYQSAWSKIAPEKIVRIEVPVEKPEPSIKELINEIPPRYGVSPILMAAIVERESGTRKDAIRFEPSQMERARKITKDPEQQRMYASSHGITQVMGWHAPRFGISWADLYRPETSVEVGSAILRDCMEKHKTEAKFDRIYHSLACYNGSEEYARAVIARLSRVLIEKNL